MNKMLSIYMMDQQHILICTTCSNTKMGLEF